MRTTPACLRLAIALLLPTILLASTSVPQGSGQESEAPVISAGDRVAEKEKSNAERLGPSAAEQELPNKPGLEQDAPLGPNAEKAANESAEQSDDDAEIPITEPTERSAQLVRVLVPISGTIDTRAKQQISRIVDGWSETARRPILVVEFWPPEDADKGNGSEFERSLSLARYLASDELRGVRTVAYVPRTIRGHAVLPVLACEEIIMHPDATLGEAGVDEASLGETVRQGYREVANRRRTIPPPVAIGMLDRSAKIYKVTTAAGVRYVAESDLEKLQTETNVQSMETMVEVGDLGRFTGKDLRLNHSFVSHLAVDRRELAAALDLAIDDLDSDASLESTWKAARVSIEGRINDATSERVQRSIHDATRMGQANLIVIHVNSRGGSTEASLKLANYLSGLDRSQVRTVAFIENEARADAALIALACDHVLMTPNATIGGDGIHVPSADQIDDLSTAVREFSNEKSRRWSLPVALFDPDLVVHQYTLQGTNVREYFCADEVQEQQDPERWQQGDAVTVPNQTLVVQGMNAAEMGIARNVVDNASEIQQLYQLEKVPFELEPGWVDNLISVLAKPQIAGMLLFIACFALIGELSAPGIGIGGFLSAVCFVVYFWSQTMNQTADLLEVLLFLTGVGCVLVEVFVVPGFGVFGVGGGLLILTSLVLASQSFLIPKNSVQLGQLSTGIATVLSAMAGIGIGMIVMRRYMDKLPIFNRVMLSPPVGADLDELNHREAIVDYAHLLNMTGVTTTRAMPSGKAQFGRDTVDVISDGEYIPKDAKVKVVDVQGNRVLVEPI